MKKIQVYLTLHMIKRLHSYAEKTGIRWMEHIRMAILEYLNKNRA